MTEKDQFLKTLRTEIDRADMKVTLMNDIDAAIRSGMDRAIMQLNGMTPSNGCLRGAFENPCISCSDNGVSCAARAQKVVAP